MVCYRCLFVLGLLLGLCLQVQGAILNVPNDYATVQLAISAASINDVVEIDPGVYDEELLISGKTLTLRSSSGNPANTVLTGNGSHRVLKVQASSIVTLENLSLSSASPSAGFGGGLYVLGGTVDVIGCVLSGNAASKGAGITGDGGGTINVTNSLLSGNSAATSGGGVYATGGSDVNLTHCVLYGNTATTGGGTYNTGSSVMIANSILWNNSSQISGAATVTYSNVQGGYAGAGNIDADPKFVNALAENFELLSASPCVDAGNSDAVGAGMITDLSRRPRRVDAVSVVDSGIGIWPIVDMGAYEFQHWANMDSSSDITYGDFASLQSQWLVFGCGLCGFADLTGEGDVTMDDLLLLIANWLEPF